MPLKQAPEGKNKKVEKGKSVDEVTRAILYPWVRDALQLVQEARRDAAMRLALITISEGRQPSGLNVKIDDRLRGFVERCDAVLRASSE